MVADVGVEGTLYGFDALYSYEIPGALEGAVTEGMRVVVPFGRGNKKRVGLVFAVRQAAQGERLKPICAAADSERVISPELLQLCVWLRENTFCTYFDAFRAILPPGLGYSLKTRYRLESSFCGELTEDESRVISALRAAPDRAAFDAETAAAQQRFGARVIAALVEKGALGEDSELKRRVGDETVQMLRALPQAEGVKLTPKQRQVLRFVEEAESASVREACYACTVTPAVIKRLVEKGLLEQYENIVFRTETAEEAQESPADIIFSPKQQEVYDGLEALMDAPEPKCALLRGVTGSGKTSVFIKLIEHALSQGKTAVMLVPEISLTPQMVGRFRRLFGGNVAVMHSSLSLGERADEYRRIREGRARIVIGTRSAVFAPVSNLGIIVIDEEGEGTYKSENAPRYHARDVAKQRCFAHGAFLLLASATPSIESCYFAKKGRYSLFELDERYNNAVLPDVYMVDMREEAANGNVSAFSAPLVRELEANLERGEQSILLLNRRGYHTSVRCAACGKPLECPNCSLPLTYHKVNGSIICHYCGYIREMDRVCPECGARFFSMKGTGTQRIEDEISALFPTARVLRMDADTTSTKNAFETKFRAFAEGEYDIIVGTQMIAKGLDFPNVTLVGVLKTDNSLYAGDFRAYERTFSLITQVVGRSGRGGKRGRALIQTFSPDHYVLNLAARQDYPAFYEQEIALREAMLYPPFCDIIVVGFSSLTDKPCENAARLFADMLLRAAAEAGGDIPLRVLGPAPYTIGRLNGRFRYRLMIKCRNSRRLRALMEQTLKRAYTNKAFTNVSFFADMNGDPE